MQISPEQHRFETDFVQVKSTEVSKAFQEAERVKPIVNTIVSFTSARVKNIKQDTGYPFCSSVKYRPIFNFFVCQIFSVSAIALLP